MLLTLKLIMTLQQSGMLDIMDGDEVKCCHEPYPYGAPDFPEPHFDLEFYATLPMSIAK